MSPDPNYSLDTVRREARHIADLYTDCITEAADMTQGETARAMARACARCYGHCLDVLVAIFGPEVLE
jgi:hypothetical protein